MATATIQPRTAGGVQDLLTTLAQAEGAAGHAYPAALSTATGPAATRNLADAVHYLCVLHGRHPGLIDIAAERAEGGARILLIDAAQSFAEERAYITRLVVAVGPLPSTPGQAQSEAAVHGQHHALDMLARSDRAGCGLGAAFALMLDWPAVRLVLDAAARRFGVERTSSALPDLPAINAALAALPSGLERAVGFGGQQLLAQHRGLWNLLEAREIARREH